MKLVIPLLARRDEDTGNGACIWAEDSEACGSVTCAYKMFPIVLLSVVFISDWLVTKVVSEPLLGKLVIPLFVGMALVEEGFSNDTSAIDAI